MSFVIGIDQSALHTGVCLLNADGSVYYLGLIEPRTLKEHARLAYIRDQLAAILKDIQASVGVLEGYSYNSHNRKFLLGEIGSIVKLALHDHCAQVCVASPKQLKKFVTGKGSAEKKEVISSIAKQWGIVVEDDNLADAYGLARIAYEIAQPATTKRNQLDVIKAMCAADTKPKRQVFRRKVYKDAI